MDEPNLLAIVGPTGVGKTAFGIGIAQKYGCELISADSRQVYIGMDIGTGKEVDQGDWIFVNERKTLAIDGVLIHGLDIVEPNQEYSVAEWCKLALQLIEEIYERGKYPVIIGGTGFYLDALQGKIETLDIPPDDQLRAEISTLSIDQLQQRLAQVDGSKLDHMNESDRANPARLIRAIEIAVSGKRKAGSAADDNLQLTAYNLSKFGLTMNRDMLLSKVDARIDQMVEQGLIDETRTLIEKFGTENQAMTGIGYAEVTAYLQKEVTLDEAISAMKQRTRDYIKRQYTWFNKQSVTWVNVETADWQNKAELVATQVFEELHSRRNN